MSNGAVPQPAGTTAAEPLATRTNTMDPKEAKQIEKTITKEAKVDEKTLKSAEKNATAQTKAEAKSLKAQNSANKAREKAIAKKEKYAKGLARQQQKYDGAVMKLNKAEEALRTTTEQHKKLLSQRDSAVRSLEQTKSVVAQHEAKRESTLKAVHSATGTA